MCKLTGASTIVGREAIISGKPLQMPQPHTSEREANLFRSRCPHNKAIEWCLSAFPVLGNTTPPYAGEGRSPVMGCTSPKCCPGNFGVSSLTTEGLPPGFLSLFQEKVNTCLLLPGKFDL